MKIDQTLTARKKDMRPLATKGAFDQLSNALADLSAVDMDKVKRPGLGDESLSPDIGGLEGEIKAIEHIARTYGGLILDATLNRITNSVQSITNHLEGHASLTNFQYIQNRTPFLHTLRAQIEEADQWKPAALTAAIIDRGILDIEDFKAEIDQARADFTAATEKLRKDAHAEADKIIAEAREIKEEALKTAMGVSVKDAQEQFRAASEHDEKQVKRWTCLAWTSVGFLLASAVFFLVLGSLSDWKDSLGNTLLRIFLLSALAGMTTFAFRMLRAHLHIAEKNRHRVRVANSIESFVHSAKTPSQRDLILARLTDSIVNYGDSGLVHHEREDRSATMSGDLMGRIVAAISGKGP